MTLWSSLRTILGFLFGRPQVEMEIEQELQAHLRKRADDLEGQGFSRGEAERQARIEFGGYQRYKEECREALGTRLLAELIADVRYGLRQLRRNFGHTAVAVITLALGSGATTAMFCVVDAVFLHPLPYRQSGRLVSFFSSSAGFPRNLPAPGSYAYWRTEKNLFEGVAADDSRSYRLTGDGEPEQLEVEAVSPELFPLLGVTPQLGRVFGPAEDKPGTDHVVLLSYRLWRGRFGGDPTLVGRNILLNGEKYTVDGVMRPDFSFPFSTSEAWVPIDLTPEQLRDRWDHYLNEVVGRLRPGVTLQKANAELLLLSQQLARAYPATNGGGMERFFVEPLRATYTRDARGGLLLLMAAVTFILLIACANVASLLLSRIEQREHEIATRTALGASRARILAQLLTESAMLAIGGSALGIVFAERSLGFLKALIPGDLVHSIALTLDARVLAFLVVVLLVSTLLFGSAPGMRALQFDLNEILKQGPTRTSRRPRLGELFVVAEIALSLTLVVGGGLLLKSFWKLRSLDPGFRSENVTALSLVTPTAQRFVDFNRRMALFDRILERVRALPGVKAAAFTSAVPLTWTGGGMIGTLPLTPQGALPRQGVDRVNDRVITPGYFEALRIPLYRGRFFDENDGPNAPLVAIVNETMARTYWPNQDAIGKQFKFGPATAPTPWIQIVGVVGDVRQMGLDQPPQPEMYLPYRQANGNYMVPQDLVVRTRGTLPGLGDMLRRLVWSVDPDQPVSKVMAMSELVNQDIASRRLRAFLLSGLAGMALILACVGIYGVMTYVVTQRTHEIGIRAALGATPDDIVRSILGCGARLTLLGVGIGLAGAAVSGRLIAGLLFGVKPHDPLTVALAAVLLAAVSLLACYIPAQRATKIDPVAALRSE
ncbi:MAG TPA: ABC transporter permease [Terriglobales bacterium]|nr:ABC transporter permease [Terriglobales bacterium]